MHVLRVISILCFLGFTMSAIAAANHPSPLGIVQVAEGKLSGVTNEEGVSAFLGVPFAQPPLGEWRWREPQNAEPWSGIRAADHFGPHAMQNYKWKDIVLRSEMSEDCLYLNIWSPARSANERLPVLVYFHGGGLYVGSGDEPRYEGAHLAEHGVVVVTVNYRLGVFGFLAHPDLTRESPHHASGNYGFMDQTAGLRWIHGNIHAFGGDSHRITIGGQSAGSESVTAQMVSPLSQGLFSAVLAESGSILGVNHNTGPKPLHDGETWGQKFASVLQAESIAALRKLPATTILAAAVAPDFENPPVVIDGYFLTEAPRRTFETGREARVPILGGWTSAEEDYHAVLKKDPPTKDNYRKHLQALYGENAQKVFEFYAAATDDDVKKAATQLATDRAKGQSNWKTLDEHAKHSGQPVFRYLWSQLLPPAKEGASKEPALGAPHSAEISYLLGNLDQHNFFTWTLADYRTSLIAQKYLVNFLKAADPNGPDLPPWPSLRPDSPMVMILAEHPHTIPEPDRARHLFLDTIRPGE